MNEKKQAVADFMNRLYRQGLTTTSGGNISVRLSDELILLTPSATDKGNMKAAQIATIGMDGSNHTPYLKPSGETSMHLEIYKRRPDVQAIVHAHPPMASIFTTVEQKLNVRLLAETYAFAGDPVVAPYALTGTQELANSVAGALGETASCALLQNHGVLTIGTTLIEAFDRMEVLENAAKVNVFSKLIGEPRELTTEQCEELDKWVGRHA